MTDLVTRILELAELQAHPLNQATLREAADVLEKLQTDREPWRTKNEDELKLLVQVREERDALKDKLADQREQHDQFAKWNADEREKARSEALICKRLYEAKGRDFVTVMERAHKAEEKVTALRDSIAHLFPVIAHGDESHRVWLLNKLDEHFSPVLAWRKTNE